MKEAEIKCIKYYSVNINILKNIQKIKYISRKLHSLYLLSILVVNITNFSTVEIVNGQIYVLISNTMDYATFL